MPDELTTTQATDTDADTSSVPAPRGRAATGAEAGTEAGAEGSALDAATSTEGSSPPPPQRGQSSAEDDDADFGDVREPVTSARDAMRVVRIALLTALLLNTAGVVRAGLGMPAGPVRETFLAIGQPLDTVARALDLDKPRMSLDAAFGHPDTDNGTSTRLEQDAAKAPLATAPAPVAGGAPSGPGTPGAAQSTTPGPPAPRLAPVSAGVRQPTAAAPLRILVTGDSLSDFDGQWIAKLVAQQHLPADIRMEPRNGTGLTQPNMFDWASEAAADASGFRPDVVVMVLGANDGWPISGADAGSDKWVEAYARRVEAVTNDFLAGDPQRRVYWVGPPIPRSQPWIHIFDRINQAVREAVPNVPGLRYVDVATPTSVDGSYTDYLTDTDGKKVLARQRDGIHYSWPGSVFPARIILSALQTEYGLK